MVAAEESGSAQGAPVDLSALSDLDRRTLVSRTELATLFRAIQGVAGLAACNLEAGGPVQDLCGLLSALGQLDRQASDEAERYGALLGSAGSA